MEKRFKWVTLDEAVARYDSTRRPKSISTAFFRTHLVEDVALTDMAKLIDGVLYFKEDGHLILTKTDVRSILRDEKRMGKQKPPSRKPTPKPDSGAVKKPTRAEGRPAKKPGTKKK